MLQTSDVAWLSVGHVAGVHAAVDNIGDLRLVDFTGTDNVCLSPVYDTIRYEMLF